MIVIDPKGWKGYFFRGTIAFHGSAATGPSPSNLFHTLTIDMDGFNGFFPQNLDPMVNDGF